MARFFSLRTYLRVVGAAGALSLAFFLGSLVQFFNAEPVAGAIYTGGTPGFTVNHFRKGDRLPLLDTRALPPGPQMPDGLEIQSQGKVPLGCDPAFSPVTSPALANLYGRCMS